MNLFLNKIRLLKKRNSFLNFFFTIPRNILNIFIGISNQVRFIIFGNTISIKLNIFKNYHLKKYQKIYKLNKSLKSKKTIKRVQELNREGCVKFVNSLDSKVLENLKRIVNSYFTDKSKYRVPTITSKTIHESEKILELQDLLTKEITDTINLYYGCAFRIEGISLTRNHAYSKMDPDRDDLMSNVLHHDNFLYSGIRVFVYLSDNVNKNTGAFRYHNKKNSRRLVRTFGYFKRGFQPKWVINRHNNKKNLRFFNGNSGDSMIVHTQECLHGASVPKGSSFRDMVQFVIHPAPGKQKSLEDLFKEIKINNERNLQTINLKTGLD